jgi:vanillate O-demethylase ferredoxin subunit
MPSDTWWATAVVERSTEIVHGVRLLDLILDRSVGRVEPGSHLELEVRLGGRPARRSYSVVTADDDRRISIAVKHLRAGRGGSAYVHTLRPGDRLLVDRPQNLFPLSYEDPEYLLVAGGIGVTPLFGMAISLVRRGLPVRMVYVGRRREEMPLLPELAADLGSRLAVFASDEGRRLDLAAAITDLHADSVVYLCGPFRMQDAVRRMWAESGRPSQKLRLETFGNSGQLLTESFSVRIPRLGRTVEVPADRTMLEALEEAGIEVLADCRRGECGLCALPVLQAGGEIDHRDVFLSPRQKQEGGTICTCVSRATRAGVTVDTADR